MARWEARVHRQALQAIDAGSLPVDEDRRQAVRAGLDGDGEHDECAYPPPAEQRADENDSCEHGGDDDAAGKYRTHQGSVDPGRCTPIDDPGHGSLVCSLHPVDQKMTFVKRKPRPIVTAASAA